MYFGTDDGLDIYLQTVSYRFILISPGLNYVKGTVAFQSFEEPEKYICIENYNLKLRSKNALDDIATFADQTTFYKQENKYFNGSVAFESYSVTNYFIRQTGVKLKMQQEAQDDLFPRDASFKIILPAPNGGK